MLYRNLFSKVHIKTLAAALGGAALVATSIVPATLYAGSIFNTLIYLLPALAGTIVDRYGFRRSLMLCFSIFSVGYLIVGASFWFWNRSERRTRTKRAVAARESLGTLRTHAQSAMA